MCLSYVFDDSQAYPVLYSHKKRTLENLAAADIILTQEEKAEVTSASSFAVKGDRYFGAAHPAHLWG